MTELKFSCVAWTYRGGSRKKFYVPKSWISLSQFLYDLL